MVQIAGQPPTGAARIPDAVILAGIGCVFCFSAAAATRESGDGVDWLYVLGGIFLLIALCLPGSAQTYLDLTTRQVVSEMHYAGLQVSRKTRAFDEFSAIVVRHLVQAYESGDSYTGSVGLKPLDGGNVMWLKNFPTTADEIPAAAHALALELQHQTGLPLHRLEYPGQETGAASKPMP